MPTVTESLRFDYSQAVQAARELSRETQELASAQRQMRESAVEAERALRRLEDLAASTAADKAALAYRREAAEIERLAAATGRHDLAAQAMVRLNADTAQSLQANIASTERMAAATLASSAAANTANVSAGSYKAGLFSLQQQLIDMGTMAASGANPLTILALQGPQIATAAAQMGGFGSALRAIGGYAVAAAPAMSILGVALAATATVYAVYTNATMTAASEARDHNKALIEQAMTASKTADEVERLVDAWGGYTALSRGLSEQLGIINGTLDETAVAAQHAADKVREAARENVTALAADVAQLRVALTAAETAAGDRSSGAADRANASAASVALRERLAAAEAVLASTRAQVDSDADLAAGLAEYAAETKKAAEAERARAEAMRDSAAAARAAEAAWDRYFESVKRADEITAAGIRADKVLEASRATTEAAAQWALYGDQIEAIGKTAAANEAARKDAAKEDAANIAAAAASMGDLADETDRATRARERMLATAGDAATAASTVQSGVNGLMQVVQQMGPVGQIVAAVVQIVSNIERFLEGVHDFVTTFADTISRLPDILADSMIRSLEGFDLFSDALDGFFEGLVERLPDFIAAGLETIPKSVEMILDIVIFRIPEFVGAFIGELVKPQTWVDVAKALIEAIVQAVGDFAGSLFGFVDRGKANAESTGRNGARVEGGDGWWKSLGDSFESAFTSSRKSYDTGGRLDRTGFYMGHQGERVLSYGENRQYERGGGGRAGGVNLHFNGPILGGQESARAIVDMVRAELGSQGQRLSFTVGG